MDTPESNPGLALYGATKFAIRGITQTAARDLADKGITVNAYCPGIVKTPMMEDIAQKTADEAGKPYEWGMEQYDTHAATSDGSDKRFKAMFLENCSIPHS